MTYFRGEPAYQPHGHQNYAPKPKLPNFDHFVRTAGQPNLAYRSSTKLESGFTSPPTGQRSLPTPPSTSASRPDWLAFDARYGQHHEQAVAVIDDYESPIGESYRRASFRLPENPVTHSRTDRAFSVIDAEAARGNSASWRHGYVVNEQEIPGKGLCYVYDDGTICPKEVNGDAVNPKWGTTKAGKPRKRLGQACNACRDKKIRCDPQVGVAKCTQCLRSNRECYFSNGSRQGHRSPKFRNSAESPLTTSVHSPNEYVLSRKSSFAPTESSTPTDALQLLQCNSSDPVGGAISPTMSDRQVKDAPTPSKRQRVEDDQEYDNGSATGRQDFVLENARRLGYAPEVDPVIGNLELTIEYLQCFMQFINVPTFEVLPPQRFTRWAQNDNNKSLQDRIALYALLAFGSINSNKRHRVAHRAAYKSIVYHALEHVESQYCLQTVHTLLWLAFAEFADAQYQKGHTLFVRCVGAMSAMHLNVEQGEQDGVTTYGFSPSMYAECCRRTYWAAFCTDAFSGLSNGNPRLLHDTDIFLRLPCTREMYDEDRIPSVPVYDHETVLPKHPTTREYQEIGYMSWLLYITVICSEVQLNSWRCQHHLRIGQRHIQDRETRAKLELRLKDWAESYNQGIRAKEGRPADAETPFAHTNDSAARARQFSGLDIIFHYAHMELNRRVYHRGLVEQEFVSHARNATIHAVETLKLAQHCFQRGGSDMRDYVFVTRGVLAGYCVHAAIDIVTAAGKTRDILAPQSSLLSLMYSALEMLELIGKWWASARIQHGQAKERVQLVFQSAQAAANERKQFFYCSHPMIQAVDTDFDLIYGTDRRLYLRAAYGPKDSITDNDIFEIDTRERDVAITAVS